jgi:hypothetical protein
MTALELESRSCPCNGWAASDKRWRDLSHEIPTKIHPEHQAAFQELLRRRWFARVWIIQEIANARAARIVCGTKSVAGRILAAFPFLLWDSPVLQCQAILDVMPGPTRESSWWCVNHSLSMLLRKFWSSEATDPRDRIYALLGISSDASNMKVIEPNYERDEKDVVISMYSWRTSVSGEVRRRMSSASWGRQGMSRGPMRADANETSK